MTGKFRMHKPTILLVVGIPGSGKSALSEYIVKHLIDAAFLSKDLIQTAFTSTERVIGDTYSLVTGPTVHLLASFCDMQLSLGKTPIIDAPYSRNHNLANEYRDWVSFYRKVAEKYDARLAIVRCLPPSTEELRRRIQKRVDEGTHPWDQALKLENWEAWLREEPKDFPILHDDVYEIVSDKPIEQMAKRVLEDYLGAKKA